MKSQSKEIFKRVFSRILLRYFRFCAKLQLKKQKPLIIGVAGAAGKTSLCQAISSILKTRFRVKESAGSNSESGIPFVILGIKPKNYSALDWARMSALALVKLLTNWEKYDIFVAEMGLDSPLPPKNLGWLLGIIQPKICAISYIGIEHSENFDYMILDERGGERKRKILELTALEYQNLVASLPINGSLISEQETARKWQLGEKTKARLVTVGAGAVDFQIKRVFQSLDQFEIEFERGGELFRISLPRPLSQNYSLTLTLAVAVAEACGMEIPKAIEALEKNFEPPPGRMSVFAGIRNTIILDSSYNASTEPMIDALDLLKNIAGSRRKVAILGDIREFGKLSAEAHQVVAEKILEAVDFAILIGPLMGEHALPVLKKSKITSRHFSSFGEAKSHILSLISDGDMILVKGSQNTLFLERAVEMLLKNPEDQRMLCRRGAFWDKKREQAL